MSTPVLGSWAGPLVAWHADPAGEVAQPRQRAAGIEPEQVFGHPADGRAVADLGGRGPLSGWPPRGSKRAKKGRGGSQRSGDLSVENLEFLNVIERHLVRRRIVVGP
jgi:hypothetical protein